ncbi:MAG: hypothetical protein AAFP86_14620, partial [Planctomycetota bacterium]
ARPRSAGTPRARPRDVLDRCLDSAQRSVARARRLERDHGADNGRSAEQRIEDQRRNAAERSAPDADDGSSASTLP